MKKLLMALAVIAVVFGAWSDTETVGSYTWTYRINGDTAEIYKGSSAAISPKPTDAVIIPSSLGGKTVTSIGNYAFRSCSGMTSVAIPNSVTNIGNSAFYGCSGLTGVHITDLAAWCNISFGTNPLEYAHTLYLNGGVVTNLSMPDYVTSIRNRAFSGCRSLTKVTIHHAVTNIGDYAFYDCDGLTSITMTDSITHIGEGTFSGCSGLTSLTIPNSVTNIGESAFSGCTGLTNITIPDSVTEIGEGAFDSCCNLLSVTIPNSVTKIGDSAFYYCNGLTNVTIDSGVRYIGYEAFRYCDELKKVIFTGNAPEYVDVGAFDDVAASCVAVVYKGTTGWDDDHDGKWEGLTLQYVDGPFDAVRREWFGVAGDGKFSNPTNWQYSEVPPDGSDVVIGCKSAMTLNCDIDFKPRSITFSEDSELVTIGGNGTISEVYAITNNTTQQRHHVFNCPVSCKSGEIAKITLASGKYMDFAGGITMTNIDRYENPKTYCGTFTVTTTSDWNSGNGATLLSGSTLNLPNATYYDHNGRLTIESGATCRVKQTKTDGSGKKYLTHRNDGVFIADVEMFSGSSDGGTLEDLGNWGDGVFITKMFRVVTGGVLVPRKNTVLGPDGIVRKAGHIRLHDYLPQYFGSYGDWSMFYSATEDSSNSVLYKRSTTTTAPSSVTFDTADWYDKNTPHTIRCKAPICGENASVAATLSMIVVGTGEFSFECSYDDTSAWKWFSGGLAIKDTATVRIKAACKPGSGSVDMDGGTTLALPTAGTAAVTFGGDYTVSGVGKVRIVLGDTNDVLSAGIYTLLTASSLPDTSRLELVNRTAGVPEFSTSADGKTLFLTVTPPGYIVVWVGGGKSVAVPLSWLDAHPAIVAAAGGDRAAALQSTSANGRMSVVECYVVGLDPEKADEDFKITSFPMNADGTPDLANVVFDPPLERWNVSGAQVVWKGAKKLDGTWRTVPTGGDSLMRFFKAVVRLGNEPDDPDDAHDCVQLWEGGPYWATTNVGAEEPWEYGYYFWWGDTVGYFRSGGIWTDGHDYSGVTWVSSKGVRKNNSPFTQSSCPTYGKADSELLSAGYIDSTGNLAPEHDASHVHWGGTWRMPTADEVDALVSNCTATWITTNGVSGQLVTGKGDYANRSIFLPATGTGVDSKLDYPGSYGPYWSSTSELGSLNDSWRLYFNSSNFSRNSIHRYCGQSVRPVRDSAK